jgi:hypothetical protein
MLDLLHFWFDREWRCTAKQYRTAIEWEDFLRKLIFVSRRKCARPWERR